jgi:hypothetical protein
MKPIGIEIDAYSPLCTIVFLDGEVLWAQKEKHLEKGILV